MRLGIVVPALDEAARIAAALDALAPLRAAGHHVVVVDGGSRDETVEQARPRADRVLVAPRGRAVQMNVGAHAARGSVLLFLHADVSLPDGAAAAIERAVASGAQWGRFDVTLEGRSRWLPLVAAGMNTRSAATGICTGDQALFVGRDAFEAVGGFPAIALMEDIALSARLRARFGPPARLRERVVASGRRWERHGALRTIASMWRLRHAYWRGADPDDLARRYYGISPASRPVLQVFAKAPAPGRVKTRLAQAIGAEEATRAYVALAEHTLGVAAAARRAGVVEAVELWVEPGAPAGSFDQWMSEFDVPVREQRGADLGERMHAALRDALTRRRSALLIGTDVPGFDVPYLAQAAAALGSHDAVIGPAEDSGYVLIGLARDADAFSGIAWSTRGVLDATRARLRDACLRWHELPPLWDVDTHDDWQRWRQEMAA